MLIMRLVLHSKHVRSIMGAQDGPGGLYKAIVTMLVDSDALYDASFALFVGPWASVDITVGFITAQILRTRLHRFVPHRPSGRKLDRADKQKYHLC